MSDPDISDHWASNPIPPFFPYLVEASTDQSDPSILWSCTKFGGGQDWPGLGPIRSLRPHQPWPPGQKRHRLEHKPSLSQIGTTDPGEGSAGEPGQISIMFPPRFRGYFDQNWRLTNPWPTAFGRPRPFGIDPKPASPAPDLISIRCRGLPHNLGWGGLWGLGSALSLLNNEITSELYIMVLN